MAILRLNTWQIYYLHTWEILLYFCHVIILLYFPWQIFNFIAMATSVLHTWQSYWNIHGNFHCTLPRQKITIFFAMTILP